MTSIFNEIQVRRTIKADGSSRYECVYGSCVILTTLEFPSSEKVQLALEKHRQSREPKGPE